ncbi:MAG: tetrahydrofolate dehydrogenase/cyclohydrolase catalytic domain-containing protein, partial [Candidatus Paceibacterota bacterium]
MIVDGKKIAAEIFEDIKGKLAGSKKHPVLCILTCAPNPETRKYLKLKQDRAASLGIDMMVVDFYKEITTAEVEEALDTALSGNNGIIVQLPFPSHIDVDALFKKIPSHLDTDVINYDGGGEVLPAVVGAIKEISDRHGVEFAGKNVVVIGRGRLVGKP